MFLLVSCLLVCGLATDEFEYIYNTKATDYPLWHHKDFVEALKHEDKRRALLSESDFFHLSGIKAENGEEHTFLVKRAMSTPLEVFYTMLTLTTKVVENGRKADVVMTPVFNGYLAGEPSSIFAASFSTNDELSVLGMIHFASGEHHTLQYSSDHGLFLQKVDNETASPQEHIHKCEVKDHTHLVDDVRVKKRDTEVVEALQDNGAQASGHGSQFSGIGTPALLQIELVLQSDVEFAAKFPRGVQQATDYVRTVVSGNFVNQTHLLSAINVIYERDLRATLVLQYFAFHTSNAPTSNLNDLDTWLKATPQVAKWADVAVVLQGKIAGGLGFMGTGIAPNPSISDSIVCGGQQTAHLGITGTWGTSAYDSPNDVVITAHEIGHILGSHHTHDINGYDPLIDSCGISTSNPSVVPSDGGSIMSYCHVVTGGKGWGAMALYMGAVGKFGNRSERVNARIRSKLESSQCLTSSDPSWAPSCPDTTTYTWNDGRAISCSLEAAKGNCDKMNYMAAPNCMKSCNRCKTTTTPVIPNIPLSPSPPPSTPPTYTPPTYTPPVTPPPTSNPPTYTPPSDCIWSNWSQWSGCSVACGGGTRSSTRTVQVPASNGGAPCTGSTVQTQTCNQVSCTTPTTSDCTDTPHPQMKRDGLPVTCQNEALLGKCNEWYNKAPYCKASCGWNGCPIPCDDLPSPYAKVTSGSTLLVTCAQQARAGFCTYGWMNARTCRISCRRCSGAALPGNDTFDGNNGEDVQVTLTPPGEAVDNVKVLHDQGSHCIANKGMPSTRYVDTSSGARAVDDFTVPAGSTWSVRKLQLMGSWFTGSQRTTELPLFAPNITFAVTIFHRGTIQCKTDVVLPLPLPEVIVLNMASSRCFLVGAHEALDGSLVMSDEKFYLAVAPYLDVNSQFYWSFSSSKIGGTFKWRDVKNIFGLSKCSHWTDGTECGLPTFGTDLCFRVLGGSSPTNDLDLNSINKATTSNGGDGEVGDDLREAAVAWTPEAEAKEARIVALLRENAEKILADLREEEDRIESIPRDDDLDEWVIPLVAVVAISGILALLGLVLYWRKYQNLRRKTWEFV